VAADDHELNKDTLLRGSDQAIRAICRLPCHNVPLTIRRHRTEDRNLSWKVLGAVVLLPDVFSRFLKARAGIVTRRLGSGRIAGCVRSTPYLLCT
jgi:hypothetical protein